MYVTTKQAGDIAITAAEGGIGYWSQIDEYKPSRWDIAGTVSVSPLLHKSRTLSRDFMFYSIRVVNDNEDGYDEHPYAIDTDLIQRGVNLYVKGVEGNFEGRRFYDPDLSMMDSDEADCVIQLGLFGKLVYG